MTNIINTKGTAFDFVHLCFYILFLVLPVISVFRTDCGSSDVSKGTILLSYNNSFHSVYLRCVPYLVKKVLYLSSSGWFIACDYRTFGCSFKPSVITVSYTSTTVDSSL